MTQILETDIMQTLTPEDFAWLLGEDGNRLPQACVEALTSGDMSYRILTERNREECLQEATRALIREPLERSGPERLSRWEAGWGENLREYREGGHKVELLRPKYMKHRKYRLSGDYIHTDNTLFEETFFTACRHWLFDRYLADVDHVVEFGCGTGTSLLLLGESQPGKRLVGCDWAEPSQRILTEIGRQRGLDLTGVNFDMFNPQDDLDFPQGAGVMTFTAMEQLGTRFEPFAEWLLERRPSICFHIEPTPELYDESSLFDFLAREYHRRRNYLTGFLPWLQQAERAGRIELLQAQRLGFGSFFQEAYTILAWRPI